MNKQELINDIKSWRAWCTEHNTSEKAIYVKSSKVKEAINQLDEQPKVKVPWFVAEWIEYVKEKGDSLYDSFKPWDLYGAEYTEANRWINKNGEIYARAWLDGYEVEKEQLYYVRFPEKNTDSYNVYGLKKYSDGKINIACYDKGDIGKSSNSQLTEQEIKDTDERYWAFAVPVEEVER